MTGCQTHVLKEFIDVLERHFGKGEIEITSSPFTNCGLRHIGLPCGGYTLDQIEYVNALKPIVSEELMTAKAKAFGPTSAEADTRQVMAIEKGVASTDAQSKEAPLKVAKLFLSWHLHMHCRHVQTWQST